MSTSDLYLETVRLTNKVRMYRVTQIRKLIMNMKLTHIQKKYIEQLEAAVKANNHYEIDSCLEELTYVI